MTKIINKDKDMRKLIGILYGVGGGLLALIPSVFQIPISIKQYGLFYAFVMIGVAMYVSRWETK